VASPLPYRTRLPEYLNANGPGARHRASHELGSSRPSDDGEPDRSAAQPGSRVLQVQSRPYPGWVPGDRDPWLVLLNGPPGIGKSTLANWYVRDRPLSLALDIDIVRRALGGWQERQEAAGLLARAMALAMSRTHLLAGHDVVVPQYVARVEFIEELGAAAKSTGARFCEVYLTDDKQAAIARFRARGSDALLADHHMEAVSNVGGPSGLAEMFDRIELTRVGRPDALTVLTVAGDVELAYRDLIAVLDVADGQ
jgi:predicted kinase